MTPWKKGVFALGLLFTSAGTVRAECLDSDLARPCGDENIYRALNVSSPADSVHWNQESISAGDSVSLSDVNNDTSGAEKRTYEGAAFAPIYGTDSEGRARMYACDPYSGCR